ncbi:oxidoreductase [Aphanothece hegewaldii CCALA 016]|uniref:Oxidoreductase n=1 Tax=Aphanothece hegewaldii CCALA 016 TaxID=2107694 RepID=A0A2T1LXK2_9CHRO|nr:SDR family oxidoreductase [Aphanothece hegewaldii]PSF37114.1 oxidoreductase [Aphanothece hegewaldii CCALA 016]
MTATILITGGSQGIGKATAYRFAQEGYNIILAARQSDRLNAVADELSGRFSIKTLAIPTDVRDPAQVNILIQKALNEFMAIDVLVNNSGIYVSGPIEQFTLEEWHRTLDTNLWGYIHTIHALLPHMLLREKGTIINLCSIGGTVPLAYLVPYTTSKYAINGMTQALYTELAPKGIHVGGIYPNLIKTNFLERAIFTGRDENDQQMRRQQVEQLMNNPLIEKPEDVANAVWDAVQHKKEKVFVGSAQATEGVYTIVPSLIRWVIRKTFQHKDVAK